jgi:hypothetical protein
MNTIEIPRIANLGPLFQASGFNFKNLSNLGCKEIKILAGKSEMTGMLNLSPNEIVTPSNICLARPTQLLVEKETGEYYLLDTREEIKFQAIWPGSKGDTIWVTIETIDRNELNSVKTALSNLMHPDVQKLTVGDFPTYTATIKRVAVTKLEGEESIIPAAFLKGCAFGSIGSGIVPILK